MPHCTWTLVDTFYKNINNNEFTGVLFVDFAKAFDVIDHDLLYFILFYRKLALYGWSNDTLHLIASFLSTRGQWDHKAFKKAFKQYLKDKSKVRGDFWHNFR